MTPDYEKLGLFYLGKPWDPEGGARVEEGWTLYDSRDLVTHGLIVGMTGSGKTGLAVGILEEAAIDGVPCLVIDPKGDLGNRLLTFPDLAAEDFEPWVDPVEASRKGIDVSELARRTAATWREGLEAWGQGPERIRRLRDASSVDLYTPGSSLGTPVALLGSLDVPETETANDPEAMADRVHATAAALLALLGIDADPVKSRELLLLSTLLHESWSAGRSLDLPSLIQQVQSPPVRRLGVLELESFYPEGERFELAMALNQLLASPTFAPWREGVPLDVDRFLYDERGKPRQAIFSLAHLSDEERMFFVTLLLDRVLAWSRRQSGTRSLRALLYMDEVFGFLPPVAEPPSKRPLLTLLKQGRASGTGVLLATQNPADLDYKAIGNIGTWFLGRLQTERDRDRLLEGLMRSSGASGLDRGELGELIGSLPGRVFLLHDVHADGPEIFQTRWVMSYLKGPLSRDEMARLAADRGDRPVRQAPVAAKGDSSPPAPSAAEGGPPVLPPGIRQRFVSRGPAGGDAAIYRAWVVGRAEVLFDDPGRDLHHRERLVLAARPTVDVDSLDWGEGRIPEWAYLELEAVPPAPGIFDELPPAAGTPASFESWARALREHLYREHRLVLRRSEALDLVSRPEESERQFRIRLGDAAREERARQVDEIRERYQKELDRLEERRRKAEDRLAVQREQLQDQRMRTAISVGSALLGGLLGRRSLGRLTTAARSWSSGSREAGDVDRAQEEVDRIRREAEELSESLRRDLAAVETDYRPEEDELTETRIRPKKSDIEVEAVELVWEGG